jgi:chromosome segregation ATPase
MSAHGSFWRSFGNIFRPGSVGATLNDGDPGSVDLDSAPPPGRGPLARLFRGEGSPLQESQQRLHDLIDAMHTHFLQQDSRAAQLSGAVERVAAMIEQLSETQKTQAEHIRAIAQNSETAVRSTTTLADTLARMPVSMQAQAEALRGVARELQAAREADLRLVGSLERFGDAADKLHASSAAQVDTLARLSAAEREQRDVLAGLVREQGRRFAIILTVAAVLALGSLAALGIAIAALQH